MCVRHASTKHYVNPAGSQTGDLRRSGNIPGVTGGAARRQQNRFNRARNRCDCCNRPAVPSLRAGWDFA